MKNWTRNKIAITRSWDGLELGKEHHIELQLQILEDVLDIRFQAPFYNDPPPKAPAGSLNGLWEYEVVEVFIAHGETYTELEFGPHGHYLLLKLEGVRNLVVGELPLNYTSFLENDGWKGEAQVKLSDLPAFPWTFNAFAIHGVHSRVYKAAFPPGGAEPDFHRLDSFKPF